MAPGRTINLAEVIADFDYDTVNQVIAEKSLTSDGSAHRGRQHASTFQYWSPSYVLSFPFISFFFTVLVRYTPCRCGVCRCYCSTCMYTRLTSCFSVRLRWGLWASPTTTLIWGYHFFRAMRRIYTHQRTYLTSVSRRERPKEKALGRDGQPVSTIYRKWGVGVPQAGMVPCLLVAL